LGTAWHSVHEVQICVIKWTSDSHAFNLKAYLERYTDVSYLPWQHQ